MTDPDDVLDRLADLKAEYRRLDAAREKVKEQLVEAAVEAFRQGKEAADIYADNPLSDVWLRGRVREAGIPKAKPGTKPKPRPKRSDPPPPRTDQAVMRASAMPSTRKPSARKPKTD